MAESQPPGGLIPQSTPPDSAFSSLFSKIDSSGSSNSPQQPLSAEIQHKIQIYTGTVKFWFRHEDNGFIVCDELEDDVFVMKKNLTECEKLFPGQTVTFELALDDRGRIQARNVESQINNKVYTGRVISWKKEREYGFIECSAFQVDIFALATELLKTDHLIRGEQVRFQVIRNAEKRMQAIEVQAIDRIKYPEKKENLVRMPAKAIEIKKPSKTNPWSNRGGTTKIKEPQLRKNSDPNLHQSRSLFPANNSRLSAFDSIFHENPLFSQQDGSNTLFESSESMPIGTKRVPNSVPMSPEALLDTSKDPEFRPGDLRAKGSPNFGVIGSSRFLSSADAPIRRRSDSGTLENEALLYDLPRTNEPNCTNWRSPIG